MFGKYSGFASKARGFFTHVFLVCNYNDNDVKE